MRKPKTFVFKRTNGKRYRLDIWEGFDGLCDPPDGRIIPAISLPKPLGDDKRSLELLIHEALHAINFDMTEEKVDAAATDVARLLWKVGYRLK